MALVQFDIDAIRSAVFGKNVREAIADALEQFSNGTGAISVDGLNVSEDISEDSSGLVITIANQ